MGDADSRDVLRLRTMRASFRCSFSTGVALKGTALAAPLLVPAPTPLRPPAALLLLCGWLSSSWSSSPSAEVDAHLRVRERDGAGDSEASE